MPTAGYEIQSQKLIVPQVISIRDLNFFKRIAPSMLIQAIARAILDAV